MSVLNNLNDQINTVGSIPSIVYIKTDDTQATVTTAGYLVDAATDVDQAPGFNFGPSSPVSGMLALVYTTDNGPEWYGISVTGANATYKVSLIPQQSVVASVSGTPNRITATAGPNVVIDISAAYVGQTSITTLGLITTVTGIQNSVGAVGAPTYTFTGDTDTGMWHDGVNNVTFSVAGKRGFAVISGNAAADNYLSAINALSPLSPALAANGGAADLDVNIFPKGTGVLAVFGGGANAAGIRLYEQTSVNYIQFNGPNVLSNQTYTLPAAVPTVDGQVLSSTTAGVMSWASSNAANWVVQTVNLNPMVADTYYLANGVADITFTMPANPTAGQMFWVVGMNAAQGWKIQLAANQIAYRINGGVGDVTTAGGTITWSNIALAGAPPNECYSGCWLVCSVGGANARFVQIGGSGNPEFA